MSDSCGAFDGLQDMPKYDWTDTFLRRCVDSFHSTEGQTKCKEGVGSSASATFFFLPLPWLAAAVGQTTTGWAGWLEQTWRCGAGRWVQQAEATRGRGWRRGLADGIITYNRIVRSRASSFVSAIWSNRVKERKATVCRCHVGSCDSNMGVRSVLEGKNTTH